MSVNEKMTAIATEIRTLTNTTDKIGLDAMKTHLADANTEITEQDALVEELLTALEGKASSGSADPVLQEKTVSPSTSKQTVTADSGYDGLSSVTVNAMTTATQATPSISVSTGGLITASATQTAGYVASGTKSATKQLTTQAAQTITPGTSNKTIASGRYLTGTQTIKGDANLIAGNIKSGVSIFGVAGSFQGGEDVTEETNTYTNLLTELNTAVNALPDAGSGSGGIETCTVTIDNTNNYYTGISLCYSVIGGTSINTEVIDLPDEILELNVVKGTSLTFIDKNFKSNGSDIQPDEGDLERLLSAGAPMTSTVGCTIFLVNSDGAISLW